MTTREVLTPAQRKQIVHEHNNIRRSVPNAANMMEISYDMELERVAQTFVDEQARKFGGWKGHNYDMGWQYVAAGGTSKGGVGENMSSGRPSSVPGGWVNWGHSYGGRNGCSEEQAFWLYKANYWTGVTPSDGKKIPQEKCRAGKLTQDGHYTQVVFARTSKIGCGYNPLIGTVCNYVQGRGGALWKPGKKCSKCDAGYSTCNKGLCVLNPEAMKKHLIERAEKSVIHKEVAGKRQAERKAVWAAHNKAIYARCNVYDRMAGCC